MAQGAYRTEEGEGAMDTGEAAKTNSYFPMADYLTFAQVTTRTGTQGGILSFFSLMLWYSTQFI